MPKSKDPNPPASVRLSDEDRDLFFRAMALEEINALSPWMLRAARLHAKKVIREQSPGVDVAAELDSLRSVVAELRAEVESLKNGIQK